MTGSLSEQFGPYRVYEQLGVGGMASVHRAEMGGVEGFSRSVALKRMLPHVAANDEMVRAFVREARLASHLRHENVAQTYELGRVDKIYFIAMELVQGRNLREILKHCAATNTGPMPVPIALHILNQICDALDYAHNLCDESGQPFGIIHRDVTPSNIIVSEGGVVKLIDFGIAKASAAGMQTMSGTLKGKFGYMAPEYIAGSIDARADLFALGVIAHELLTNRPLFTGRDDLETLTRVQQMEISPPSVRNPNVPREVDDIVMTALARDPERRWQHATALRSVLGTITQRMGLTSTNTQVVQWVEHAFDQTRPRIPTTRPAAREEIDDGPSISMSITDGTAELSPDQRFALLTPLTVGRAMPHPDPDTPIPAHTPSRITAQRSIPPENAGTSGAITNAAATIPAMPVMGRDLAPAAPLRTSNPAIRPSSILPAQGLMAEDILPRVVNAPATPQQMIGAPIGVRPSQPQMQTLMMDPPAARIDPTRQSSPQIALPRTVTPPQQQSQQHRQSASHPTLMDPGAMARPTPPSSRPMSMSTPPPVRTSGVISSPNQPTIMVSAPQMPIQMHMQPVSALASSPEAPLQAATPPSKQGRKRAGWVMPLVLILVVAGAAGAVVYFVLPQLT